MNKEEKPAEVPYPAPYTPVSGEAQDPPRGAYETSIKEAIDEVKDDAEEYTHFVDAIRKGKPWPVVLEELGGAVTEAGQDLEKVIPAARNVMYAIRSGTTTSEFQLMSGVNKILTYLAFLAPVLEMGVAALKVQHGMDPQVQGHSFIVSGVMMFFKTFIASRYAGLRENIKIAAINNSGGVELHGEKA